MFNDNGELYLAFNLFIIISRRSRIEIANGIYKVNPYHRSSTARIFYIIFRIENK